jgi:hypothetical protein
VECEHGVWAVATAFGCAEWRLCFRDNSWCRYVEVTFYYVAVSDGHWLGGSAPASRPTGATGFAGRISSSGKHHDLGTDRRAFVEVDDVLIDHADTAGRNVPANRPGFESSVDPIERVFIALPQIHGASA